MKLNKSPHVLAVDEVTRIGQILLQRGWPAQMVATEMARLLKASISELEKADEGWVGQTDLATRRQVRL